MRKNDLGDRKAEIEEIVERVQDGDHEAFAALYDIFVDHIYRYVYYRVNAGDVEDLVETVFMKVWENIRKYRLKKKSFSAWIFRITHNLVVDYYRNSKEREVGELQIDVKAYKREHNPIRVTEDSFDQSILKDAFSKMKRSYREVLIYKFINELPNSEISLIMGKSEGSLRILQHRALKALKNVLGEMGVKFDV
ncbi:MAG: sigma-70 family RNA polymerase sigma factor [Candidatus Peregrinibacteria bacterium]